VQRTPRDGDPPPSSAALRSVAAHIALSGYPREAAERRLQGMLPPEQLRRLLDDVYGTERQLTPRE
jgi:hypothetical protein